MKTLAEVREQVLKYVPVMARPMVLYGEYHPVRWTGVHADTEVSTKTHETQNTQKNIKKHKTHKKMHFSTFLNLKFRFLTYRRIEGTLVSCKNN